MPATDELFPPAESGDPILAETWNDLTNQVMALSGIGDDMDVLATGAGIFRRGKRFSAGLKPYIITGDTNAAYFGYLASFTAKKRDGATDSTTTADDVDVSGEYLTGIVFTGSAVLVTILSGGKYAVSGGRGMRYVAFAEADIAVDDTGDVRIQYTDAFGDPQEAVEPAVNKSGRGITEGTELLVDLIGSEELWIVEAFCS